MTPTVLSFFRRLGELHGIWLADHLFIFGKILWLLQLGFRHLDLLIDASQEAGEHFVSETDIAVLQLIIERVFAAIKVVDVALIKEQLERIEVLDERFQSTFGDLIIEMMTGEVVAFHQRGNGERDRPVGRGWLCWAGQNGRGQ